MSQNDPGYSPKAISVGKAAASKFVYFPAIFSHNYPPRLAKLCAQNGE
jgi:hypothetical protein